MTQSAKESQAGFSALNWRSHESLLHKNHCRRDQLTNGSQCQKESSEKTVILEHAAWESSCSSTTVCVRDNDLGLWASGLQMIDEKQIKDKRGDSRGKTESQELGKYVQDCQDVLGKIHDMSSRE